MGRPEPDLSDVEGIFLTKAQRERLVILEPNIYVQYKSPNFKVTVYIGGRNIALGSYSTLNTAKKARDDWRAINPADPDLRKRLSTEAKQRAIANRLLIKNTPTIWRFPYDNETTEAYTSSGSRTAKPVTRSTQYDQWPATA